MQFCLILSFISLARALVLPGPSGPHPVSMVIESLTDKGRPDPYAPSSSPHPRRVMTSLFLPINSTAVRSEIRTVPYMTPLVAADYGLLATSVGLPNSTFASFEVNTTYVLAGRRCSNTRDRSNSNIQSKKIPLVIFSPGFGQSRLLYGIMARSMASEGYAVVTIDHPYDASIVEFPDGSFVRNANISTDDDAALEQVIKVRSADVSFVIDQLKDAAVFRRAYDQHKTAIDFDRIVMYGHSLGGATAATAMLSDPRILGGVDLDGRFFNPVLETGLDRPFLLLGRQDHSAQDPTWAALYEKLRGARVEMSVAGTVHSSFTDYPFIVDALKLPKDAAEQVAGSVSGQRMDTVVKSVLAAFCEFVFGSKAAPELLKPGNGPVPELTVVQADLRK
ncbi:platelet-activating factor acetylhydrolase- isoform II domain-containing protein [Apiospora hydei]|uniref:1-alkyl-2-acetylglycerophosphocholine esterase n=1 Tax=Apiospora hydei TaxID=1337664 RepID=A0ABR1UV74_9PEZI